MKRKTHRMVTVRLTNAEHAEVVKMAESECVSINSLMLKRLFGDGAVLPDAPVRGRNQIRLSKVKGLSNGDS